MSENDEPSEPFDEDRFYHEMTYAAFNAMVYIFTSATPEARSAFRSWMSDPRGGMTDPTIEDAADEACDCEECQGPPAGYRLH